jgi:ubiquinone/menaquinone biosynthesis C-methylase UbiE
MDNTSRFDGLAEIYDANRPSYPTQALGAILARLAERLPRVCLDVGAGTGIATRAFANALPDWQLVAIEPNIDMVQKARTALAGQPNVRVERGDAENLPAADASSGLVTVAQALHWFDRPAFFAEARRVLAASGVLAILNNNRRTHDSPALLAMEDFFEAENPDYSRDYRSFDIAAELACTDGFGQVKRSAHAWTRAVTPESLADYFLSRSAASPIVRRLGFDETRSRVIDTIAASAGSDPFHIAIDCEVVTAVAS